MTSDHQYPVAIINEPASPGTSRALVVVQPERSTPLMTVLAAQMCIYAVESAPTCSEASRLYRATLACVPMHD